MPMVSIKRSLSSRNVFDSPGYLTKIRCEVEGVFHVVASFVAALEGGTAYAKRLNSPAPAALSLVSVLMDELDHTRNLRVRRQGTIYLPKK